VLLDAQLCAEQHHLSVVPALAIDDGMTLVTSLSSLPSPASGSVAVAPATDGLVP
jgi:hypothetical protein